MHWLLAPFSFLYGLAIRARHLGYDLGILKSHKPEIPVIVIGNLSAGGTGKTPHTLLIAELLSDNWKLAVLSRGYGRTGSGYHEVSIDDDARTSGDEPLAIKKSLPLVAVAVCVNRIEGISRLQKEIPDLDLILLDDAFQHRRLNPGFSILLIDYSSFSRPRLLLPAGYQRDVWERRKKADVIVISKSPETIGHHEKEKIIRKLRPVSTQSVFFSSIRYLSVTSFEGMSLPAKETLNGKKIILVTGIADASNLVTYLKHQNAELTHFRFADHHNYSEIDIRYVNEAFGKFSQTEALILTTSKDKVKLFPLLLPINYMNWFVLDIGIRIDEPDQFEEIITTYVGTATRNIKLHS